MSDKLNLQGKFKITVRDKSGLILAEHETPNTVMTEGVNHMYDVLFHEASATATWYIGLINATPTPVVAVGDTMAQIGGSNGWTEYSNYTGDRKAWVEAAAASRAINTTSASQFTISGATGTENVWGAFLCSAATGTSGVLWSAANFAAAIPVVNGNIVDVSYASSVA